MLDFNAQLLELVYWRRLDFSAICYCPQWLDRAVSDRGGHTCIIQACLKTGVLPSVKKRDPDCKAQNNSSEFLVVSWSPWVGWWKWPKLETPLSYWGTSVLIWAMTVNLNDLNPGTVLALEYLSINNTPFNDQFCNCISRLLAKSVEQSGEERSSAITNGEWRMPISSAMPKCILRRCVPPLVELQQHSDGGWGSE